MQQTQYGIPRNIDRNERHSAQICRVSSTADIPWRELSQNLNEPIHISVQEEGKHLPLEALYIPRNHDDLVVGIHGGLEKRVPNSPYFQYVWSFKSRPESLLFLFDSTLYLDESLYSSYFLGTPTQDLVIEYAALINSLREATKVSNTLLCGHSSGGTAALKIGSRVPESRSIVGNPMIPDKDFVPRHLELTRKQAFPLTASSDDFYSQYADRAWVFPWIATRVKTSTFTWFVHKEDISMVDNHAAKRFAKGLGLDEETGGNTRDGDAIAVCNWTYPKSSHMLPFISTTERYSFIPFIEHVRGEPSNFDPNILAATNPKWAR